MEYIPTLTVLSAFTVASVVLALSPGPDMTLFFSRAITQSRAAGLICFAGAVTGIWIQTILAALGISALIAASPKAFFVLKLIGAFYLFWLAIQAVRKGAAFLLELEKKQPTSLFRNWLTGLGINLANPKIAVFFITFLPQFVSHEDPNAAGKMIFLGFFFTVIATIIYIPLIVTVEKFASKIKEYPSVIRAMDWTFASVFSVFAIRILLFERG